MEDIITARFATHEHGARCLPRQEAFPQQESVLSPSLHLVHELRTCTHQYIPKSNLVEFESPLVPLLPFTIIYNTVPPFQESENRSLIRGHISHKAEEVMLYLEITGVELLQTVILASLLLGSQE